MIQRFIELGEGYSDIYELIELMKANRHRAERLLVLETESKKGKKLSLALVLKKTDEGNFQAIYLCREGIPILDGKKSERLRLTEEAAESHGIPVITLTVQPSDRFAEKELYYQYLTGILRMNRYLSPLT
ncbi:methylthioribose kinase [Jeotgalibacillus sp. R-1-5s-1]|uniref:DUF7147 family protein n=1 Tax=Jeotgalibacillus sp. R-1-5s-1 TaxID=2555897 RepID=UPI00106D58DB|nr:methylthioribose kinase [Jeotgalibacillus sp. R-1-5s-1]TFE03601.1 methylthioribose kinase [Jeotgalibacillus sp. R-1-5s-1]